MSPRDLALIYDRYVAAGWRGEAIGAFDARLEAHWTNQPLPTPDDYPDAVSDLGGAARSISWHAHDGAIAGYVAGRIRGGYLVPVCAEPPPIGRGGPGDPTTR
jgi:hypothetical protein